jgi:CheY-like chemotaxis protein
MSPDTSPQLAGPRILVVDDNEDSAWLLAEALRGLGYEVRTSHDGGCALDVARSWPPQIVLLDLGLPDIDGCSLCRQLLELPDRPHMVAVTGYGKPEDRERAMQAGFEMHLVKPVSLREVESAIATLVVG